MCCTRVGVEVSGCVEQRHFDAGVGAGEEDGEEEAGGAGADDYDFFEGSGGGGGDVGGCCFGSHWAGGMHVWW